MFWRSLFLFFSVAFSFSCQEQASEVAKKHLINDFPALTSEGHVKVLVEIPAGTNAKWEVSKEEGALTWEENAGKKRMVNYLPYPANYGLIPQTLMDPRIGGDGDALDVILLGEAVERGSFHDAKLLGVLKLLDRGEQDDKLIAISSTSTFKHIQDFKSLQQYYPGLTEILETWFGNYKGQGKMEVIGWGDEAEAKNVLEASRKAFKEIRKK